MAYLIMCRDQKDSLEVRKANRPAHLEYLARLGKTILFAGPLLDHHGTPIGSMIGVDVETRKEAKQIAANDPYEDAGLFKSVKIAAWTWVVNKPEEG